MSRQVVNVGTTAGDHTGDSGQTPFKKVNANSLEIYSGADFKALTAATTINPADVTDTLQTQQVPITVNFTGDVHGASSGTLTTSLPDGPYYFTFSSNEQRWVVVSGGTAVTWGPALFSVSGTVTSATYDKGVITFSGSVGGATSGTLTASITNGNYVFTFSNGDVRAVTVTGGTACSWFEALTAGSVTTASYAIRAKINASQVTAGPSMTGRSPSTRRLVRPEAAH